MPLLPPLPFANDRGPSTSRIVPIPGQPGESISSAILPDVRWLIAAFKVKVNDGYAASGHAAGGDHPKGGGVDLVPDPSKGGTWNDVDRLAAFAKDHPDTFRWIGYDGVPNHGRGHHLHLSWRGFGTDGDSSPVKLLTSDRSLIDRLGDFARPGTVAGAGGAVVGAGVDEATELAGKAATAIVGLLVDAIGEHGARVLLSIGLVLGAVAAIAYGASRTLGLRTPSIGSLVALAPPGRAAKAATAIKGAT